MNSQDFRNLQEAYMDVYDNNLNEESKLGYLGKQKRKYNNEKNASDKYTGVKMPSDVNHTTNQVRAAFRAHRKNKNLSGNDLHKIASASESFDLYDIILSHLLDEGYAETQEQAEVIMVNMSEDWRESIFENVSSGKGRVTRYVQSKPTGPVTNRELDTSRQKRMDAENDRIKKIGDEAHAAATSKGLSFAEAEFRRKRAELRARKNS